MKTIGIFPATGALGTSTTEHLLKLVPNDRVILISRYPEKIPKEYVDAGVILRQASYESTDLETVFAGIETLFLISYPTPVHEYRTKVHLAAIEAARRAGVSHIFYSSLAYGGPPDSDSSAATVMQAHLDVERYLRKLAAEKALTYTAIREGVYAETAPLLLGSFDPLVAAAKVKSNPDAAPAFFEALIPHDGTGPGAAWVKRDELGEATAKVIARQATSSSPGESPYTNKVVLLSGPRDWSLGETARLLGELVVGRPVRVRQVSVEEYARQEAVLAHMGSEEMAKTWATSWEGVRQGATAAVTSDLEEVLGRKPTEFEDFVREFWVKA